MYSEPYYHEPENLYIFFLDSTIGNSNTPENLIQMSNLFILANIISSYLIINCFGDITESSLKQFGLINSLQENITFSTEQDKDSEIKNDYLAYYLPKVLWAFRDYPMNLEKNDFCPFQRLHTFLNDSDTKNKISLHLKNSILDLYKDLDCLMFNKADFSSGRSKNWQNEINVLKEKILQKIETKSLNGINFNCRMFCSFIHSLIEEMNGNCVLNLNNALEYITENECIAGYNDAIEEYHHGIKKNFETDEVRTMYDLISVLKVDNFNCFFFHLLL